MVKISDLARSTVHDYYTLFVKDVNGNYKSFARESDFSRISLIIEELECSDYFIERATFSQYIPKKRERFKLNGK